jgi:hypothetical protein
MSQRELLLFCKEKEKKNYYIFYVKEGKGVNKVYSKYYYTGIKLERIPKKKVGVNGLISLGANPELQRFIGEEKAKPKVLIERMITQMGFKIDLKNLEILGTTELKT